MTVGVAPYWTKDTVKCPEVGRDGLVIRGRELATFTLAVNFTEKKFIRENGQPVKVPDNFVDVIEYAGDREIIRLMESQPTLATALRSLVVVLIVKEDASGRILQTLGSGVALSRQIIFTAEHLFYLGPGELIKSIHVYLDDGYKEDPIVEIPRNGVKAMKMELPPHVKRLTRKSAFYVVEWGCPWEQFLDFAVLKTETSLPIPENASLLEIEDSAPPRQTVICALGVPGNPIESDSIPDLIPLSFRASLEDNNIPASTQSKLFQELYQKAMHDFSNPIGSFGCVKGSSQEQSESAYYCLGTFSSANGMSGGPVVALNDLEKLVGIVVGSLSGVPSNAYLRADAPPVLAAYRYFVTESLS